MLGLPNGKFDEENERQREEDEPPGKIPEKLCQREEGDIETEEEPLAECARDIGFGRTLIQKVSGERKETEREERGDKEHEGEEKYPLPNWCQRYRIYPKNENAEDAEGREREETKDDN